MRILVISTLQEVPAGVTPFCAARLCHVDCICGWVLKQITAVILVKNNLYAGLCFLKPAYHETAYRFRMPRIGSEMLWLHSVECCKCVSSLGCFRYVQNVFIQPGFLPLPVELYAGSGVACPPSRKHKASICSVLHAWLGPGLAQAR